MMEEGKKYNCPKCGCFLKVEETNIGVDEDCFSEYIYCNNKKCDWKEPVPEC